MEHRSFVSLCDIADALGGSLRSSCGEDPCLITYIIQKRIGTFLWIIPLWKTLAYTDCDIWHTRYKNVARVLSENGYKVIFHKRRKIVT